jgi:hypothetical protein
MDAYGKGGVNVENHYLKNLKNSKQFLILIFKFENNYEMLKKWKKT